MSAKNDGGPGWVSYSERRPQRAGVFRWRLASVIHSGMVVEFSAKMRERGAGYTTVISPEFDHWDGYSVWVPPSAVWADHCGDDSVVVAGHSVAACGRCGKAPTLFGYNRAVGGLLAGAHPHEWNDWGMKCCAWTNAPRFHDPRDMLRAWSLVATGQPAARENGGK